MRTAALVTITALTLTACTTGAAETTTQTTVAAPSAPPAPTDSPTSWPPKYAIFPEFGRPLLESERVDIAWTNSATHDGHRLGQSIDLFGDWADVQHDADDHRVVHISIPGQGTTWDFSPVTLGHDHYFIAAVQFSGAGEIALVLSIFDEFYEAENPDTILYLIDPATGQPTEVPPPPITSGACGRTSSWATIAGSRGPR